MTYKMNGNIVDINMSDEEIVKRVAKSSTLIKTMTGIGNNAAWACCLEALDAVRSHPNYKQRVKQKFMAAMDSFKRYERTLIYARENRLFHLDDLMPEYRKRYGNITDREYYEFWAGTGTTAYEQKKVWVTNLWNKFRLSLIHHKIPNEETVAWAMTAAACLKLAVCIYENSINTCAEDFKVPVVLLEGIFGQLNLSIVDSKWDAALTLLEPWTAKYDLTELEQKNIQHGLNQLQDEYTSIAAVADSITGSIESYSEVFRTAGEQKKALRQVAEMRH
jgi:hypothetical protein